MRLFVYEFISGGGLWCQPHWGEPNGTLLAEGQAMLLAIVQDLLDVSDIEVSILQDQRVQLGDIGAFCTEVADVQSAYREFDRLAIDCDGTLIIAPEIDNCLWQWTHRAIDQGARLIGPGLALVEIASNKQRTVEFLAQNGVPVPDGRCWNRRDPLPDGLMYPLVAKPTFGAGCHGVRKVSSQAELSHHLGQFERETDWRLETYCAGTPASVSAICGSSDTWILPPCTQRLKDDLTEYLGGDLILEPGLVRRAETLAKQTLDILPEKFGYISLDLQLGHDPLGSDDYVIEVNPRLTTSYVPLRARLGTQMAQRMVGALPLAKRKSS